MYRRKETAASKFIRRWSRAFIRGAACRIGQLIQQLAAAGRLLRLGLVGREALNEGLQFLDFVLAALLLVVHQAL